MKSLSPTHAGSFGLSLKQLNFRWALLLGALVLLFAAQGLAQEATIVGTVTDPSGAAVANAKVTLTNTETGISKEYTTNDAGQYTAVDIHIGHYDMGYKSAQRDLSVSVAMRYEVDATLQRDSAPSQNAGVPAKPILAPKAKEALDKGLKALSKNKLSEAEKYLTEASKLAPGHPDVLYVQGVLFLKQQNWPQAQSALEKASQMEPTSGRTFSALGMAFVDQGNYEAAIAPLEKSVQLNSGTWETQWALGKAYYHREQYDQALKASQLAWEQSNGKAPQIELLVAQSLTAVGKYEDAAQSLRDFLKRYGDRPEAPTAKRWLDGLAKNGKIHSN